MAKILGKANLFAACDYSQKKSQKGGGQRVVYFEKKTVNKRRFYQVPIKAQ
ncbi:hypothetical protein Goari_001330, partial [Gossypium aridum]|nr:hypothetical protein [Gossypium aridum]